MLNHQTQCSVSIDSLLGELTSLCVGQLCFSLMREISTQKHIVASSVRPAPPSFLLVGIAFGPWTCCDELNTCLSDAQWTLTSLPMVVALGRMSFCLSQKIFFLTGGFPCAFCLFYLSTIC